MAQLHTGLATLSDDGLWSSDSWVRQSGFTITRSSPYRPDTVLVLITNAFKSMPILFQLHIVACRFGSPGYLQMLVDSL